MDAICRCVRVNAKRCTTLWQWSRCDYSQYPMRVAFSIGAIERMREVESVDNQWTLIAATAGLYTDGIMLSLDHHGYTPPHIRLNADERRSYLSIAHFAHDECWFVPTGGEFDCDRAIASLPNGGDLRWIELATDDEEDSDDADMPF